MATHAHFDVATDGSIVAAAFSEAIRGRVFLITGVSEGGLGGATAKALASQSPKLLVLTGRSRDRVEKVMAQIRATNPAVSCRFLQLDLASKDSIKTAASQVLGYSESIDVLINNAGIMDPGQRRLSEDGIELHFATNHLGHFRFTTAIMPSLIAAAKVSTRGSVRIINLSSYGYRYGGIRFSDFNFDKSPDQLPAEELPNYDALEKLMPVDRTDSWPGGLIAYGQSKTANILFSVALNNLFASEHGIISAAIHPGTFSSDLGRHFSPDLLEATMSNAKKGGAAAHTRKTLEQASSTTLVAALDPALAVSATNVYMESCQFVDIPDFATDQALAQKLWTLSESLTK